MGINYIIWVVIIFCANKFRREWYGRRLTKIADFYTEVYDLCDQYDNDHVGEIMSGIKPSACEWVFDEIPDTDQLVFSLKKLKVESWLTQEQYDELMKK